ncbi:phage holin family protein [Citreimonas salinaria]|uniref:Putative Holin-X, holin superfamily III n=1 Tax=Citreimonas salinaria TaxID=321339 RepID=A0A1H3F594_9RHOB|nr:phage holin family protein [Citreimonas salinaria]SDX86070.1 Putative Holin-X, holin superfamily III [Citreimonas salinaria]
MATNDNNNAHTSETPPQAQSTLDLVREALTQVSTLVRREVDLARTEVSENMNKAVGALVSLAAALAFGIVALNGISAALVALFVNLFGIGTGWASLIVAVIFAIIAFILLSSAKKALKARSLAPTRTATNVQRDAETVKEATK